MYGQINTIRTLIENSKADDCWDFDRTISVIEDLFDMKNDNKNAPFQTYEEIMSKLETKIDKLKQ